MKTGKGLLLAVLIGSVGCRATVAGDPDRPIKIEAHVTIDVREIKQEAHSIEDMVSGPGQKTSRLGEGWVPLAWAESGLSPELELVVASRRARFGQLKEYKTQGWVGEDREGHVAVLGGGPEVEILADAENRDREVIYQETLKQKGLPADAIGTIRATFAQEQRERAASGEKIQLPSGEWAAK